MKMLRTRVLALNALVIAGSFALLAACAPLDESRDQVDEEELGETSDAVCPALPTPPPYDRTTTVLNYSTGVTVTAGAGAPSDDCDYRTERFLTEDGYERFTESYVEVLGTGPTEAACESVAIKAKFYRSLNDDTWDVSPWILIKPEWNSATGQCEQRRITDPWNGEFYKDSRIVARAYREGFTNPNWPALTLQYRQKK